MDLSMLRTDQRDEEVRGRGREDEDKEDVEDVE